MRTEPEYTVRKPAGATSPALRWARGLLALVGTMTLLGATYFSFFASAEQGGEPSGLIEWSIAAWALVLAVGYLFAAARLGTPSREVLGIAIGVVVLHIAFNLVKLIGYRESEALVFLVVDLVLFGLLLSLNAPRRRALA